MAKTADEILFDRAVRHAIFLERLKNEEVDKIVGFLNRDVFPDVTKQVQERFDGIVGRVGSVRTKRLKNLEVAVRGEIAGGMRSASEKLKADLGELAITEARFQTAALGDAMKPLVVSFDIPSVATLRQVVEREPILGQRLSGWFNKSVRDANDAIMGQVRIGLAEGQSVDEVVKRLRGTAAAAFGDGTYKQVRNHMRTLVRTSASHVSNGAREATYAANEDVIKGVQYVATLDSRTTPICMSLDGQVFNIGEGERPPQHHQCRSTTVPVTKSWKELGIDLKEPPAGKRAARQYNKQGEARLTGKVSARQTYNEWLKRQPKSVQNMALGPARADLWRDGKVSLSGFVNDAGKTMNLETLALKEGIAI